MAINIGENENGQVTYDNQPDIDRTLFKNLKDSVTIDDIEEAVNQWMDDNIDADTIADAVNDWLDEHPEATTTIEDGSILPVKLNTTNDPSDGYVLSYNATTGKFEWYDIEGELDEINSELGNLKEDLNETTSVLSLDTASIPFEQLDTGSISAINGSVLSSSVYKITNYIDVSKYTELIYQRAAVTLSSVNFGIAFYDEDKEFVSGVKAITSASARHYESATVTVPDEAKYLRATTFSDLTEGVFSVTGTSKLSAKFNALQTDKPLYLNSYAGDDITSITAGTDYDTIKTAGNYKCNTNADASSMTHCPVTVSHRLTVMRATASERFVQFITTNAGTVPQYKRYWDGTSWSSWLRIATTDQIDTVDAKVNAFYKSGIFDYANVTDLTGFGITSGDAWSSSTIQKSYTFKIPPNVRKIRVKAHSTGSIIAFLNSYEPVSLQTVDFATGYTGRITLSANEVAEYDISGNMNYFFALVKSTQGADKQPELTLTVNDTTLYPVDVEAVDETSVHDRKYEIFTMLNAFGECKLAKGVFYTSDSIYMPTGSKLIGSGSETVIKLLASVASGSTIVMGASCTVKDLTVKGSDSTKWGEATEGTRNGIEWTGENQTAGTVDNCQVINFDDAGIYLHDTTQKTYRNLSIINCYITGNYIGVDIRKDSEFNKIANCTIIGNKIGYRNRGGNNDLANSGVDANKTGILIDSDAGTNNGHGTITGCSINHSNSNTGYGIIIKDTGRMLVSNCNLYFSKLLLDTTNGNVISNCGFGTSAGWEITGGECSLFIGCMVRGWDSDNSPVTITDNTDVRIINCYDREGNEYASA